MTQFLARFAAPLLALAACAPHSVPYDSNGLTDPFPGAVPLDAGLVDGGSSGGADAGNPDDGGVVIGPGTDGGITDAGTFDGGHVDAGPVAALPTEPCPGETDGTASAAGAPELVISELFFDSPGFFELYNRGPGSVDLGTVTFGGALAHQTIPARTLAAGEFTVIASTLAGSQGEIGLTRHGSLVFYVCWGALVTSSLQNAAVSSNIWSRLDLCLPTPPVGESLHLAGPGPAVGDWLADPPTPFGCPLSP